MTKTTPHDGPPRQSTSTGDPSIPPTNKRKHMITKVVNQESVTFWYYKLNITHSFNKDSNNHFLSIEKLLHATKTPTVYITHHKSEREFTQEILGEATSIMDICTNVTGLYNSKMTTLCFCLQSTDPDKSSLCDPLDELRVSLPNYFTNYVDSFRGELLQTFLFATWIGSRWKEYYGVKRNATRTVAPPLRSSQ